MPSLASLLARLRVDPRLKGLDTAGVMDVLRGRSPVEVGLDFPSGLDASAKMRRGEAPEYRLGYRSPGVEVEAMRTRDETGVLARLKAFELEAAQRDWLATMMPDGRSPAAQPRKGLGVRGTYRVTF